MKQGAISVAPDPDDKRRIGRLEKVAPLRPLLTFLVIMIFSKGRPLKYLAVIAVFSVAATPSALAFHDLDCGPFRTKIINQATGERRCLENSPETREQFLRFRKLQQEQEKRTRELQMLQRQRAKAQALITIREQSKQEQFIRRQILNQRQSSRAGERSQIFQEGRLHQDRDAKRRGEQALKSNLLRSQNLLEQKLELPRADLLDGQKALKRRLAKDQQGQ